MRSKLNQYFPFDAITRWWYISVAGVLLGFLFSLVTGMKAFAQISLVAVYEGPPSPLSAASVWIVQPNWKDDFTFAVFGFLVACVIIWLLEEIRGNNQPVGKP